MTSAVRRLAVLTVGVLVGCGGPSPTEESRAALRSWSSSVEVAASAWLARDVPSRYLGDLLDASADGLRRERAALAKTAASPRADTLRSVSEALVTAVERMRASLEANDRARVLAELETMKSLEAPLRRDTVASAR